MPCGRDVEFPGVTLATAPGPATDEVAPAPRRRRPSERVLGWVAPLLVAAVALGVRLWHLGRPGTFSFDEVYYAKDAWSMASFGYVRGYVDDADAMILAGDVRGVWTDAPSMIVHPEVGKWLIGLGEKAFGLDPFGWRVAASVASR